MIEIVKLVIIGIVVIVCVSILARVLTGVAF